ncbi:MAG: Hsp70 family protein [Acidobacteriaceae bacterium]|nr:Hsp70 family protein [Acidobacteriaceae bacterium]
MAELVVGIDLGTTNSEIAAFLNGKVQVLGPGNKILPSVVGFLPSDELLVGETARHQLAVYPERTVRSIKRKMGTEEKVTLGDRAFTPPEISALILRELAEWAQRSLGQPVRKAVITVPAYFSDAQRNATREAGALAGLEVVRILNEPTAASLAYGYGEGQRHTALVYDLGGGTFDVSIVTLEGDITEVLSSHGNNRLGGDDFDDLLAEHLLQEFQNQHGINLREGYAAARARLWWAVEEAKKRLSFEPEVTIREEALVMQDGKPLHLEVEITREQYEDMIRPLVESTLESVSQALQDSGKRPSELDAILLVGGSTRTPLVSRLLQERTGLEPRQDVHPDLCVALGAGVLASRLAGHEVERVLVDISPYSFGVSYLGERGGAPYLHCYKPIVKRNTPLPLTRTERFYTAAPFQKGVEVRVYQGDDEDALKNILVGDFLVDDLTPVPDTNEVLCRMSLDLDGILHVTAIEKQTGKSKHITIARALQPKSAAEIDAARERLQSLYATRQGNGDWEEWLQEDQTSLPPEEMTGGESKASPPDNIIPMDAAWVQPNREGRELVERARALLDSMHDEDREEVIELNEKIEAALAARDPATLTSATAALRELLFFVEGHA